MKLYIATIQASASKNFTDDQIKELIGDEKMASIKKLDPYPYFKVYVACQEGEAKPRILGKGARIIQFTKEAVKDTVAKLKNGIKLFHKHGRDNSHEGREQIGEVVASTEAVIDGKESAVFVGYFPEAKKKIAKLQDVCSMEAVWDIIEQGGRLIATAVEDLTGVSLGRHETEIPAFKGAVELTEIQAFVSEQKEKKMPIENEELRDESVDFRESKNAFFDLRNLVRKSRALPHQLWTAEKMIGERSISKNGQVRWSTSGDHDWQDYIENNIISPILKENDDLRNKLKEHEEEIGRIRRQTLSQKAIPVLEKIAKEKNLAPPIFNLAKANADKILPSDEKEESMLAAVLTHIDKSVNDYKMLIDSGVVPKLEQETETPALGHRATETEKNPLLD